jgi:lipoprotein-releasing system ATP-binding protein
MSRKVIQASGITKYFEDPVRVKVLDNITFSVSRGEFVSVTGKSGCGKSTLLYIVSTMDTDYEGGLLIDNVLMTGKADAELTKTRNEKIGFVFQFHYLLNEFSVLDNVMLPGLKLGKLGKEEVRQNAYQKLRVLGIEKEALKYPNQLSGGEKQRVAIARALINNPLVLMCDEPTGNLDKKNSEIVFGIFKELAEQYQQALLVVTHDLDFAGRTHRIIEMEDGRIISAEV